MKLYLQLTESLLEGEAKVLWKRMTITAAAIATLLWPVMITVDALMGR